VKRLRTIPISAAFAALCANGNPSRRIAGFARRADIRNILTTVAAPAGIPSVPAAAVRDAGINGVGRRAWIVPAGRGTKLGTKSKRSYKDI